MMFALWANYVAFGNDVYCVNDVMPNGIMGKHHSLQRLNNMGIIILSKYFPQILRTSRILSVYTQ